MSRSPARKLLYSLLVLATLAMLLFLAGFVVWQLGLPLISGLIYAVAGRLLLVVFAGVALWALLAAVRGLWRDLRSYFSRERISLRRLLFQWQRQQSQQLLQRQRWQQLQYRFRHQRQRLANSNAKQQRKVLLRALLQELNSAKMRIDQDDYRNLRRALRQAYRRADDAALLALRERFLCP